MAPVLSLPPIESEFIEVDSHRVRLLTDAREAYPAMLEAIAGAKREVLFEMYWIQARFGGASLSRRAGRESQARGKRAGDLRRAGEHHRPRVDLASPHRRGGRGLEFAPISPLRERFRLDRINFRDHRKILVVDGEKGFTGGMNIGDAWLPREAGRGRLAR